MAPPPCPCASSAGWRTSPGPPSATAQQQCAVLIRCYIVDVEGQRGHRSSLGKVQGKGFICGFWASEATVDTCPSAHQTACASRGTQARGKVYPHAPSGPTAQAATPAVGKFQHCCHEG